MLECIWVTIKDYNMVIRYLKKIFSRFAKKDLVIDSIHKQEVNRGCMDNHYTSWY